MPSFPSSGIHLRGKRRNPSARSGQAGLERGGGGTAVAVRPLQRVALLQGRVPPSDDQAPSAGLGPALLTAPAPLSQWGSNAAETGLQAQSPWRGSTRGWAWVCWARGAPSALPFGLTPRPRGGDPVKDRPGLRLCSDSDGLQRTYLTTLCLPNLFSLKFIC